MFPAAEAADLSPGARDNRGDGLGLAFTPDGTLDVRWLDLSPVEDNVAIFVDERLLMTYIVSLKPEHSIGT